MSENINYKHLHYFWMVATHGSMAKAAEKLFITPQTISGQISMLEERIGHALFDRVGRSLRITDTGRIVLRYAEDIFELGSELSDALRGAPLVGPSEFIVSTTTAIHSAMIHKVIEPAVAVSEDLNLVCKQGSTDSAIAELAVHKVDMVLTDSPLTNEYSIRAFNHYLGQSSLSFCCAPALQATFDKPFPQCLDGAPILLPSKPHPIRPLFDKWCAEQNIFPNVKGEFDDVALMQSFATTGMGVFMVPSVVEKEITKTKQLVSIGTSASLQQKFYAISAERKVTHPAIAVICDTAKASIFAS